MARKRERIYQAIVMRGQVSQDWMGTLSVLAAPLSPRKFKKGDPVCVTVSRITIDPQPPKRKEKKS
jgi:hypothetical protein